MIIFLIGFMGSGKTTLGKQLAEKLGYKFIDQDELIENKFGIKVSDIFAKYGEQKFRTAEKEIIEQIVKMDKCIVATGGGSPCFNNNMEMMNNNGFTIYLKVDPEIIVERLKMSQNTRPLVKDKSASDLLTFTRQKLAERSPFYSKAKLIIYSKNITIDNILQGLEDMKIQIS